MRNILLLVVLFLCPLSLTHAQKENPVANNPVIVFETNQGTIEIKLFPDVAPKACENMIGLIKKGYYDGRYAKNLVQYSYGGIPTLKTIYERVGDKVIIKTEKVMI